MRFRASANSLLVQRYRLILGFFVCGWHALRLCEGRDLSDIHHALRKASERATPKLSCNAALVILVACSLCSFASCVQAQDNVKKAAGLLRSAGQDLAFSRYDDAVKKATEAAELVKDVGEVQQSAAQVLYLAGKSEESLPLFERANALMPERAADNWQRGIALGTCGKWAEGAKQFKMHHDVNPNDVENSAWYYLCVAKSENLEAAKKSVIPSRGDARQPMMAILQMLKGELKPDEVLAVAEKVSSGPARKEAMFYGELYVGLYYDSIGDAVEAEKHLRASLNLDQKHYMSDTSRVYLQHRFPNPNNPSKETAK